MGTYRGNFNGSQNTLGAFGLNDRDLSPASPGHPYVHGGIMHNVGARQEGFSGGRYALLPSDKNPTRGAVVDRRTWLVGFGSEIEN